MITLTRAISGYLLEAEGPRRLSPHTISDYKLAFRRLAAWIGNNQRIDKITLMDLKTFFAYLASETWQPRPTSPIERPAVKLSNKTLLNHHIALSALWTWAVENGFVAENLMHLVLRPKPEKRQIVPYSERDIQALLRACNETQSFIHYRSGKMITNARPTATRDKATLLVLLDTGIRASELCDLLIKHLDFGNETITVTGKGRKTRTIPLSPYTWKALMRYILIEHEKQDPNHHIFLTNAGNPMNRNALLRLIKNLAKNANVTNALIT